MLREEVELPDPLSENEGQCGQQGEVEEDSSDEVQDEQMHVDVGLSNMSIGMGENMTLQDSIADQKVNLNKHMGEDDILPGCPILDINIEHISENKILVRAEYLCVYGHLKEFYNHTINLPGCFTPGAMITGQPGIGE